MSYAHILGTMYEHSSYYDKGFIIDELMLYHIIYDLYHDPYLVQCTHPGHPCLDRRLHLAQAVPEQPGGGGRGRGQGGGAGERGEGQGGRCLAGQHEAQSQREGRVNVPVSF